MEKKSVIFLSDFVYLHISPDHFLQVGALEVQLENENKFYSAITLKCQKPVGHHSITATEDWWIGTDGYMKLRGELVQRGTVRAPDPHEGIHKHKWTRFTAWSHNVYWAVVSFYSCGCMNTYYIMCGTEIHLSAYVFRGVERDQQIWSLSAFFYAYNSLFLSIHPPTI